MEKIEFKVDEQYENEKGVFTVISMHGSEMVIRWESGEELRTPVELQRNIQKRRLWEKMEKEAAEAAAKNKAGKKQAGFHGFQTTDFKETASKTNWRGRNQLGGAVAGKLPDTTFTFNSWAFSTKSELHWQDTGHHKKNTNSARFFARLNQQFLTCGFCITRPSEKSEKGGLSKEWESFTNWLADEGGDQDLHALADKDELEIYNHAHPAQGGLQPAENGWKSGEGDKAQRFETLTASIENVPETANFQLEVTKKYDKLQAIARGKDIIEDLSELFTRLMPLYRAAVL